MIFLAKITKILFEFVKVMPNVLSVLFSRTLCMPERPAQYVDGAQRSAI